MGVFSTGSDGSCPRHPVAQRPHTLRLLGLKDLKQQGVKTLRSTLDIEVKGQPSFNEQPGRAKLTPLPHPGGAKRVGSPSFRPVLLPLQVVITEPCHLCSAGGLVYGWNRLEQRLPRSAMTASHRATHSPTPCPHQALQHTHKCRPRSWGLPVLQCSGRTAGHREFTASKHWSRFFQRKPPTRRVSYWFGKYRTEGPNAP